MNINFVPSLEHLALAKISIRLCNNPEIEALLKENKSFHTCESRRMLHYAVQENNYFSILERERHLTYSKDDGDLLELVQDRAIGLISPLNLGNIFQKKILRFILRIVLEIHKWGADHCEVLPDGYDAQAYFYWKSMGTIDRERTAENLLSHGNLSIKNQFFLACLYCMQSRLSFLWDNIYDSSKSHLVSKCCRESLLNYWMTRLDGLHARRSFFPDAFFIKNVSALQYFYNECHVEDQKRSLLNDVLSKNMNNLDIVQFCVSKLCQNGSAELSSLQCYNVLRCFLSWPLQWLFLDASGCLLVNLDQVEIIELLHDILRMIETHHYEDINYLYLLKELWKQTPAPHKEFLMNTPDFQPIKTALEQTSTRSLTK